MSKLFPNLFKKKPNQYHINVNVTNKTEQEKQEIRQQHTSKKGFITYSHAWSKQYTPQEQEWFIFWYKKETNKT